MSDIESLRAELKALRAENTRIRAALATSGHPCVYCGLPEEDFAKCASGFPGCAKADDMQGCRFFADGYDNYNLRAEVARLSANAYDNHHLRAEIARLQGGQRIEGVAFFDGDRFCPEEHCAKGHQASYCFIPSCEHDGDAGYLPATLLIHDQGDEP